jgi:hypothetical protein
MESQGFFEESEDLFSWTPQREARTEAAFWVAKKKRARLRGNPTKEAFARLAFQHRMQQTEDLDSRQRTGSMPFANFALWRISEIRNVQATAKITEFGDEPSTECLLAWGR